MPKHLQIRDVPDDVHDALRRRAAESGMSLSAFVLRELRLLTGRPDRGDLLREIGARDDNVDVDVAVLLDATDEGRRAG